MTWLLALFAVLAVADWTVVGVGARRAERWLKPAAMLALILVALAGGAASGGTVSGAAGSDAAGKVLLVALVCGLAGDVLLLGDAPARFLGGLGAFLAGHLAYLVTFLLLGLVTPWFWDVLPVVVAFLVGPRIIRSSAASGGRPLAVAVTAYLVVITVMTAAAMDLGRPLVAVGALSFLASDALLGWDRFVARLGWSRPVVMATYHVGQLLIVLGVLR